MATGALLDNGVVQCGNCKSASFVLVGYVSDGSRVHWAMLQNRDLELRFKLSLAKIGGKERAAVFCCGCGDKAAISHEVSIVDREGFPV